MRQQLLDQQNTSHFTLPVRLWHHISSWHYDKRWNEISGKWLVMLHYQNRELNWKSNRNRNLGGQKSNQTCNM